MTSKFSHHCFIINSVGIVIDKFSNIISSWVTSVYTAGNWVTSAYTAGIDTIIILGYLIY